MKPFHIGSELLLVSLFFLFFFISGKAVSENKTSPQTIPTPNSVSVEKNHPLAMAHQQIEQANKDYNNGDMDAVQKDLNAASKWLQNPELSKNIKTKEEAIKLHQEIQALQEKINHAPEEHEGIISRLWHRSTALIEHEIQHASKDWNDRSIANQTLKYLIDARLHFHYAEHDLFISHDIENASAEIKDTISYLDEASNVAPAKVKEQIVAIKKEIQTLANNSSRVPEQQKIIRSLDTANAAILEASQGVSPAILPRLKSISQNINNLKSELNSLENKQHYDEIMDKLHKLDQEL
jgi:hypothetical protein